MSSDVTRFIGVFYAEATPLKGLSLKTQYGVDYARIEEQRFWSPLHGDGVNSKGLANAYNTKNNRWTWTNTATYNFSLGRITLICWLVRKRLKEITLVGPHSVKIYRMINLLYSKVLLVRQLPVVACPTIPWSLISDVSTMIMLLNTLYLLTTVAMVIPL